MVDDLWSVSLVLGRWTAFGACSRLELEAANLRLHLCKSGAACRAPSAFRDLVYEGWAHCTP